MHIHILFLAFTDYNSRFCTVAYVFVHAVNQLIIVAATVPAFDWNFASTFRSSTNATISPIFGDKQVGHKTLNSFGLIGFFLLIYFYLLMCFVGIKRQSAEIEAIATISECCKNCCSIVMVICSMFFGTFFGKFNLQLANIAKLLPTILQNIDNVFPRIIQICFV